MSTDTLARPVPELKVADRCDHPRCGAQAYVVTEHDNGFHLFHCKHHFESLPLELQISPVIDNRSDLNKKIETFVSGDKSK